MDDFLTEFLMCENPTKSFSKNIKKLRAAFEAKGELGSEIIHTPPPDPMPLSERRQNREKLESIRYVSFR